jgi:hypothetical protein
MQKYLILLIVSLLIISCTNKPKNLIPREEFVNLLAEIHIYDAIMNKEGYLDKNITINDSASYYNFLFKKHQITRIDLKENIDFYSTDIEDFNLIYDEVVARLEKIKTDVDSSGIIEDVITKDSTNLWDQKQIWNLPADGNEEAIKYAIKISKHGTYTLSADLKFYPDDGTVCPRLSIFIYYTDGSYDSNSNGSMLKDGLWKNYNVSVKTDINKQLDYVMGWVLDHSSGTTAKHSEVKNIELKHSIE